MILLHRAATPFPGSDTRRSRVLSGEERPLPSPILIPAEQQRGSCLFAMPSCATCKHIYNRWQDERRYFRRGVKKRNGEIMFCRLKNTELETARETLTLMIVSISCFMTSWLSRISLSLIQFLYAAPEGREWYHTVRRGKAFGSPRIFACVFSCSCTVPVETNFPVAICTAGAIPR